MVEHAAIAFNPLHSFCAWACARIIDHGCRWINAEDFPVFAGKGDSENSGAAADVDNASRTYLIGTGPVVVMIRPVWVIGVVERNNVRVVVVHTGLIPGWQSASYRSDHGEENVEDVSFTAGFHPDIY